MSQDIPTQTVGNVSVDFTGFLEVPVEYVAPNDDGNQPEMMMHVASESLDVAVNALRAVSQDVENIVESVYPVAIDRLHVRQNLPSTEEYAELYEVLQHDELEITEVSLQQLDTYVQDYTDWETIEFPMRATTVDGQEHIVYLTTTAPGYRATMELLALVGSSSVIRQMIYESIPYGVLDDAPGSSEVGYCHPG